MVVNGWLTIEPQPTNMASSDVTSPHTWQQCTALSILCCQFCSKFCGRTVFSESYMNPGYLLDTLWASCSCWVCYGLWLPLCYCIRVKTLEDFGDIWCLDLSAASRSDGRSAVVTVFCDGDWWKNSSPRWGWTFHRLQWVSPTVGNRSKTWLLQIPNMGWNSFRWWNSSIKNLQLLTCSVNPCEVVFSLWPLKFTFWALTLHSCNNCLNLWQYV